MVSTRETKILIADAGGLFPADWIYPDDDLFPVDAGVREITNIVAGTLKLDEMIVEKTPQFGQLFSSKFEVQIYLEDDLSGKNIAVYQNGDDNILHGVFFGKIDSCKTDRVGTDRTIVAYDPAYALNSVNVAPWWTTFWQNRESATLKQVRDSLTDYLQISSEDVTLPNDSLTVTKTVNLTSCTFQQMLKMICELNCCFPHVNRSGNLDYIILDTEATPIDLEGLYEWTNSNFEEYETDAITGVQFFDSDNQLKYTVGSTENAYPISKNIFLYDANTTTLETVGNVILSYLEDLTYNPAKIKMVISDMELHLGDYVEAEGCSFYIFENSLSGSQLIEQTIQAKGDKTLYSGTQHLDYGELILNQKIARVAYSVEEFYTEYTNYAQQTTTKINQNADRIEFQAGKLSNYQGSYVPTTSNSPANTWNTVAKKEEHENEIFYNPTSGLYYKWEKTNNVWGWTQTTDINIARNLSSQLSLESNQIVLQSGRLIVETGNFQLDEDGILTATGAVLQNAKIESKVGTGIELKSVGVDNGRITFNDDAAYIEYQKRTIHNTDYHYLDLYSTTRFEISNSYGQSLYMDENDVGISAEDDISLKAYDVGITSERDVNLYGSSGASLGSGGDVYISGGDRVQIDGGTVALNSDGYNDIHISSNNAVYISSNRDYVYISNGVINGHYITSGSIVDYYGDPVDVLIPGNI